MKNNLLGGKVLSYSFYLYTFRKYVSYGSPIIHFCNPGVHYEIPCIYLRINSNFCPTQRQLIGFYNKYKNCLLRGTNWVFQYSSLLIVVKWFNPYPANVENWVSSY
jgi:hypothetical protein